MSDPADPHRTVAARRVEDIDAEGVGPGCLERLANGYMMACPGCATQLVVPVNFPGKPPNTAPAYTVTAGDPDTLAGLTLSPSIHHPASHPGGCGWHGWLREGRFVPC